MTTSPIYRVGVRWGFPPSSPETLTRNVSSSLGSLTVTAFPLIASFRVCSSVGDVELVDSKATDGLLRVLACPFLDIGARCFRLVWGDRWTLFTPFSWCSFDSESSELLFSNKKKVNKESSSYSENCGIKSQPATVGFENRAFRRGFQFFFYFLSYDAGYLFIFRFKLIIGECHTQFPRVCERRISRKGKPQAERRMSLKFSD